MLNANIYFKIDALQRTGAFKVRGVLNHLLYLQEQGKMPPQIVAYSTGNHAIAMAYAAKKFNIRARVYLPENVSNVKKRVAKFYGAEVIEVESRAEAEALSKEDGNNGFYYMHPSDHDATIAGAGTLCYEALQEIASRNMPTPDAIFASCGGGGLLAGTYLAKEAALPKAKVIGCEPQEANDAYMSLSQGKIFRFEQSPNSFADGLRALSVSPRTFSYLQKLDGFYQIAEHDIIYWTKWLLQILKITCEPSSAISMAAAHSWLKERREHKNILVLISGGNLDPSCYSVLSQGGDLPLLDFV